MSVRACQLLLIWAFTEQMDGGKKIPLCLRKTVITVSQCSLLYVFNITVWWDSIVICQWEKQVIYFICAKTIDSSDCCLWLQRRCGGEYCTVACLSWGAGSCSGGVYSGASNRSQSWQFGVKGHTHRKPLKSNLSRNACLSNASLRRENRQWKRIEADTAPSNQLAMFLFLQSIQNNKGILYLCSRHARNTLASIHTW